ncbi:hypothetical protein BCR41DRAFT_363047 [Lobosporangium transversale]|uniref:Uncharacterized protein n=1 Tax=Lobosporangium transversale TaxID=64571 RepID=A0A1Y2G8I1_9FUNG|nr:hypothetical protein BCR41DRAFT_363047 [Lobosporangium transversale]ORZ04216.1 hypothetical protein BCR41DRAFT_363047 [Lobosporangium transversale]|eukprot:XP_021876430.1 hypothetical protein BCR41DRAFT_363047 [Lobosporangium transversale]
MSTVPLSELLAPAVTVPFSMMILFLAAEANVAASQDNQFFCFYGRDFLFFLLFVYIFFLFSKEVKFLPHS